MGRKLRSFLSVFTRVHRTERRRSGVAAATTALLALAVGVYSAVDVVPAHAVTNPDVTAPERVYTGINQDLAFTNTVDPISQNNRTIAVSLTDGAVCHTDPTDSSYSILGCSRIQLDVQTTAAGKLFIPGNTVMNTAFSNGNVIVNTANHTIIDVATDPAGGPSWVYHISGAEADINDTLATMVFQPAQDYEDTSPSPAIVQMSGINGSDAAVKTVYTEIKVEGQNGAPDLTVPATNQVAPSGQTTDFPDGMSPQTDPDTNPLATAVDPEMCNLTICGAPYTNPGGVETDDAMLLIAYLDPTCGQFALRGGQFSAQGGVLNTTVLALLTNVSTGQNPGLELTGDQAAAVLSTLSLQAQTVDLQPQPSDPTTLMNAFAGVGDLAEVRYAISQIHYKAPAGDMTCQLNLAVSDLGNSGMPALKGYVGSPIGGANQPQPGYEVPDAKAVEKTITFDTP